MKVRVLSEPKRLSEKLAVVRVTHSWKAYGPDEMERGQPNANGDVWISKIMDMKVFGAENVEKLLTYKEKDTLEINVTSIRDRRNTYTRKNGERVDEMQVYISADLVDATADPAEVFDAKTQYTPRPSQVVFGKK